MADQLIDNSQIITGWCPSGEDECNDESNRMFLPVVDSCMIIPNHMATMGILNMFDTGSDVIVNTTQNSGYLYRMSYDGSIIHSVVESTDLLAEQGSPTRNGAVVYLGNNMCLRIASLHNSPWGLYSFLIDMTDGSVVWRKDNILENFISDRYGSPLNTTEAVVVNDLIYIQGSAFNYDENSAQTLMCVIDFNGDVVHSGYTLSPIDGYYENGINDGSNLSIASDGTYVYTNVNLYTDGVTKRYDGWVHGFNLNAEYVGLIAKGADNSTDRYGSKLTMVGKYLLISTNVFLYSSFGGPSHHVDVFDTETQTVVKSLLPSDSRVNSGFGSYICVIDGWVLIVASNGGDDSYVRPTVYVYNMNLDYIGILADFGGIDLQEIYSIHIVGDWIYYSEADTGSSIKRCNFKPQVE